MDREKTASRMILSVGYDAAREMLEVELTSGKVYRYFGVPQERVDAMMRAKSMGKYFLQEIKNEYECRKVAPDEAETSLE